ncbi:MAG TPA: hypothetical protein VD905_08195 [Flavobacteriales bacterium]|nr:hypothetical protein [Flavobacteriales bacterium]
MGYLLGVELGDKLQFPFSTHLIQTLQDDITSRQETSDFIFSFCKVCKGQSTADQEGVHYEGMHLDTHPDLKDNNELLRMLFNFSEHPRQFRYALTDRHELLDQGIELDRTDYKTLHLPDSIAVKSINIPGRQGNSIHFLKFWASVIPHVGITEEHGYFLISFEALRNNIQKTKNLRQTLQQNDT